MPRLTKPTLRNTIQASLPGIICLLTLLILFVPTQVLAEPPEAHDDTFTVREDSDDSENRLDVLANDEPYPDEPFVIVGVTQGFHGSVSYTDGGTLVTYQPDRNYYGADQFNYTVDDGFGGNHTATVRITVEGINDRPIAVDDFVVTAEDVPIVINVLANDSDIEGPLDPSSVVVLLPGPSHGDATPNTTTGRIAYVPDDNWHGEDVFTYRVWDTGDPLPARYAQANVYITVNPRSDRPIADAGPDQTTPTLATVTLDGSGSYDPDGEVELTYRWQQTGGVHQVTLSDTTAVSPTFVAPDDPDTLVFSLRVFDDGGQASETPDTVQVTVTNQAPVADAGPDQSVHAGSIVTLDGSGSYDPDGDALSFEWQQIGGTQRVTLSDPQAQSPTFFAPANPERLVFSLHVEDAFGTPCEQDDTTVVDVGTPDVWTLYMPFVVDNSAFLPDLIVQSITAESNKFQVVIKNVGDAPVTSGFYVDLYVNPVRAPSGAHEGWYREELHCAGGLVWAIKVAQTPNPSDGTITPLMPGASLTLEVNDAFYMPEYSDIAWPLAGGTPIYAQADSYPADSPHNGLVLETHEYYSQAYNNVDGPAYSTSAVSIGTVTLPRHQAPSSHKRPPLGE